jgi:hypothetical protein
LRFAVVVNSTARLRQNGTLSALLTPVVSVAVYKCLLQVLLQEQSCCCT